MPFLSFMEGVQVKRNAGADLPFSCRKRSPLLKDGELQYNFWHLYLFFSNKMTIYPTISLHHRDEFRIYSGTWQKISSLSTCIFAFKYSSQKNFSALMSFILVRDSLSQVGKWFSVIILEAKFTFEGIISSSRIGFQRLNCSQMFPFLLHSQIHMHLLCFSFILHLITITFSQLEQSRYITEPLSNVADFHFPQIIEQIFSLKTL